MDNYIIAKATDRGQVREVNEDSMSVFDSRNGQVLVVCDGMGGQAAGDVASQLSVSIIESILTDNTFSTPEEAIRRSVVAANQGVINRTQTEPELEGMGSTCVMLIIKDGRVTAGWVGDSRIYYFTQQGIKQISHDQSYVQQLLDSGQITAGEVASHPQKNEITNCIGLYGMTAPETTTMPITPDEGSIFMLCSDGLSNMVSETQMESVLGSKELSLQEKADKLIQLANRAGGLDNVTVELVQFGSPTKAASKKSMAERQRANHTLAYALIALLVAGAACLTLWHFFNAPDTPQTTEQKTQETGGGGQQQKHNKPKSKKTSVITVTKTTTLQQPIEDKKPATPQKKESAISKSFQNSETRNVNDKIIQNIEKDKKEKDKKEKDKKEKDKKEKEKEKEIENGPTDKEIKDKEG